VPPREADGRLPPGLDPVFAKAFATRLERRYTKAMDFARELHEAAKPVLDLKVAHAASAESPTEVEPQPGPSPAAPDASSDQTMVMSSVEADADETIPTMVMGGTAPPAAAKPLETLLMSAPALAAASITTSGIGVARLPSPAAKTLIMDQKPDKREGVLILDSDPPGAQVSVDGNPVGEAPVSDVEVCFGRHVVRMEVSGRDPVSAEIEVERERPLKAVTFTLPPPGSRDAEVRPGLFVNFGPDVTPPRRLAGPVPVYPESARERGLEGSPVVEVWVSETGDVIDVAIAESAGAILDGALLEAVAGWRFTPARLHGVPVSVRITVQHLFRR
jgi:TonB family protein